MLSIVIPVRDDFAIIEESIEKITTFLDRLAFVEYEVIVVDDASTDDIVAGYAFIKKLVNDHIRILSLRRHVGQLTAIAHGIEFARGELLLTCDADLKADISLLDRALACLEGGADMVTIRRTVRPGVPGWRLIGSGFINSIVNAATGRRLSFNGPTFKLIRREVWQRTLSDPIAARMPVVFCAKYARKIDVIEVAINQKKSRSRYSTFSLFTLSLRVATLALLEWIFGSGGYEERTR